MISKQNSDSLFRIQLRTFEILDSFGLDQIWRESTHVKGTFKSVL